MYHPQAGSARMNYYVPTKEAVETSSFKKKRVNVAPARRASRILGRRYALTATGYKYLEIGINVGPPSYVEIAVGDNHGKELTLSLETWKELCNLRWNINKYLETSSQVDIGSSFNVGSALTVRFGMMNNKTKLVYLESSDVCLAFTAPTLLSMCGLDGCIDVMYHYLSTLVEKVDEKFERFTHIASTVFKDVPDAIYANGYFEKNQLIDCELLALYFTNSKCVRQ